MVTCTRLHKVWMHPPAAPVSRHPTWKSLHFAHASKALNWLFGKEKFTNVTLIALIRAECLLWAGAGLQVSSNTHGAASRACLINTSRVCAAVKHVHTFE